VAESGAAFASAKIGEAAATAAAERRQDFA
jgi:hypothetical protein